MGYLYVYLSLLFLQELFISLSKPSMFTGVIYMFT